MKKKSLKLFLMTLFVAFVGVVNVNAASSARLVCEDSTISVGGSTTCTVKATVDTAAVTNFIAYMETSKYLNISNITPATGWTGTNDTSNINSMSFNYNHDSSATTIVAGTEFDVYSFKLTVSEEAKNVEVGECGQICLSSAFYNTSQKVTLEGGTSCPSITIKDASTTTPKTGAFANYALLGGCVVFAILAVAIVNKNSKFYRL